MNMFRQNTKHTICLILIALLHVGTGSLVAIQTAYAAETGHSGGGGCGGGGGAGGHSGGGGGSSHSGGGHEPGGHDDGGHEPGGKGKGGTGGGKGGHTSGEHTEGDDHDDEGGDHGQSGPRSGFKGGGKRHVPSGIEDQGSPSDDSEGRGPRFGGGGSKPEPGSQGGPPSWAKEGIPHVELGRLNVARSPDSVLQRAFDEVLSNWNPTLAAFYSQSAASVAAVLSTDYVNVERIDSPLGNLGMYKDLLANGQTRLPDVTACSIEDMAAITLGSASDKNIPISVDTVKAVNIILGVGTGLTESQLADIASKADSVRSAIQTGHGE